MAADKETSFLKDWMLRYVKNKDIITRKITETKELDDGFVVVKKESRQQYIISPFLNNLSILEHIKSFEHNKALVCFHTKENYDTLLKNWKQFVDVGKNFTVFFVNPFSKTERILSISPYTHQMIADDDTIELGLKTMSETVEFTTPDEVKKIISS
jgi:hypothetical protein